VRFEGVSHSLLERCRQGDVVAFEELCGQVQRDLYGLVWSMLRNHDDADEVMQECLLRMFRHLPKLNDNSKFPWWAMRIAVNQCNSFRAQAAAKPLYPLDDTVEPPSERVMWNTGLGDSPRRAVERREMREDINAAIGQLPPRQRDAIVLFEVEDLSIRQISELLGCSEGAVKFHIHEARKRLRSLLERYLKPEKTNAQPEGRGHAV
jgi:RNA polymerase sigma-70 factor, ECF subfamily